MASNLRQITSADLFFFFLCPKKSFNKPFEFLLYKTNRLNFSVCVCVYCNRSQKTSQRVKNSGATRLRLVSYFLFFTRCDVIFDLLQYTRTQKCNLFVKYYNSSSSIRVQVHHLNLEFSLLLEVTRSSPTTQNPVT